MQIKEGKKVTLDGLNYDQSFDQTVFKGDSHIFGTH